MKPQRGSQVRQVERPRRGDRRHERGVAELQREVAQNEELPILLDTIEAGVVYVNRRAGATTGAWPGVQPFGGWKGSGTSGKAGGGPYYVQQYLREQSRTVIEE